jgi:hypothetical protein
VAGPVQGDVKEPDEVNQKLWEINLMTQTYMIVNQRRPSLVATPPETRQNFVPEYN